MAETVENVLEGVDISPKGDGGVLKKILSKGSSNEHPCDGDTVSVHYRGTLTDGTEFDSSYQRNQCFEFTLGKGNVIKGWDIGVATMTKGEKCQLTCKPEYAYGDKEQGKIPPNSTLIFEVELLDFKGEDISGEKNGSILKSILKKGEGYMKPNDLSTVTAMLKGAVNDTIFDEREVTWIVGEGESEKIIAGLDTVVKNMLKNEECRCIIKSPYTKGCEKFNIDPSSTLTYTVVLKSFEKAKESWQMNEDEKIENAKQFKEKGTEFFTAGEYNKALCRYQKMLSFIESGSFGDDKVKEESKKLSLQGQLNVSLCCIKLQKYSEAIEAANKALEIDANNEKALFRRGEAKLGKNDLEDAVEDFKKVLDINPDNSAAKGKLNIAKAKIVEYRAKEKSIYAKMMKGF